MNASISTPARPLSPTARIHGLDLARFLAVMGMVYAHIGEELDYAGLSGVFMESRDGLPSALFAVLAGVSMSIMAGSAVRTGGAVVAHNRHRLIIRGLILMVLGFLLQEIQVSISVVLLPLGLAMILLSWAPRARTATLFSLLAGLLLAGPALQVLFPGAFLASPLGGGYPIFAWSAYVAAGILLHRLMIIRQITTLLLGSLLVGGALLTSFGLLIRHFLGFIPLNPGAPVHYRTQESLVEPLFRVSEPAYIFFSPVGHSGGLIDQLTSLTASVTVLALCLLLCRVAWLNRLLHPLRAAGSMSLTVYVLHVLTVAWYLGGLGFGLLNPGADFNDYFLNKPEDNDLMVLLTVVVAVVAAALWKLKFRRGPLEEWMARSIDTATRQDLPARPSTSSTPDAPAAGTPLPRQLPDPHLEANRQR